MKLLPAMLRGSRRRPPVAPPQPLEPRRLHHRPPTARRTGGYATVAVAALVLGSAVPASAEPAAAAPSSGYLLGATGTVFSHPDGTQGACTLGFLAIGPDGLARALTAAHCGNIGQPIRTRSNESIGRVEEHGSGADIALIRIHTEMRVFADVDGVGAVTEVMDVDEINRTQPLLCKKGITTGLTCGRLVEPATKNRLLFDGGALPGDSGSPVYALLPNGKLSAVGIVSAYFDDGTTNVLAVPVAPYMAQWDLRLS